MSLIINEPNRTKKVYRRGPDITFLTEAGRPEHDFFNPESLLYTYLDEQTP
jgi:hypothetical protein